MNRFLFFTCCIVLLGGSAYGRLFHYCTAPNGKIQSVTVSTCKDTDRFCAFKKNTNVSIEIDFKPSYKASSVKVSIVGEVAGVPVPFGIKPDEACSNYGLTCPLNTDQVSTFKLELPIISKYPAIPVDVTVKLLDETKAALACLNFPAKIQN